MAIALLKRMEDQRMWLTVYTYTILIDGLYKGGRLDNAQEVFQDLLTKGCHLNVHVLTAMINGLCKQTLLDDALALK
ncbi:hypothetical protein RJT34_26906 [Clitoria ternatea]|uniref:Pentatricopeptide repeat-containing protein n=1 Tax=Clitoria ternatea TaxID=43366 RepID=A0AAN9F7C6_CLITE